MQGRRIAFAGVPMIAGVVTTRTVVLCAPLILRLYGPRVLARCVWAIATGTPSTFLALVWGAP